MKKGGRVRFSIIVPVYNVAPYLDVCVQSVVCQSCGAFEVILVNDGSTDGSGGLCDAWARRDARVRVIHQVNRGLGGARNRGIAAAEGTYLLFLDSDDYWSDARGLEKLDALIENMRPEPDAVLFPYRKRNLRTGEVVDVPITAGRFCAEPETCKRALLEARQYGNSACTKAVRRAFLLENGIGFPERRKSEDLAYSRRVLTAMRRFAIVREPLLVYQTNRAGSISTAFDQKNYQDILEQMTEDLARLARLSSSERSLGLAYWAEQACWFLGFLPLSGRPLGRTLAACAPVFALLPFGLSRRTRLVRAMVRTLGKRATVYLLYLYLRVRVRGG